MKLMRSEQDGAWKDIIDAYFSEFVHYCLPELAKLIDWTKPVISLDKELQAIAKGTNNGKRLLDKLFKVFFKDGKEQWILIHLEIQAKKDINFPERMFTYAYRIWDKYKQPIVSCAILTDGDKTWRPNHYELSCAGSYLGSGFLIIKILDYENQQPELEISPNIFASVILVQLTAVQYKDKSHEQRKIIKFMLTKRLYDKRYNKQEINNLYKFIDWLISLPEDLEIQYLNDVYELEEQKKMPYISTAERLGIEKEKIATAQRMLAAGSDIKFILKVTQLSIAKINELRKQIK